MRKWLIGAFLVGLIVILGRPVEIFHPVVLSQQQCGGSFVPSLRCIIDGFWKFSNTANGGPFQAVDTQSNQTVTATGIVSATTTLTNAQVLALNLTPVTVVAAPGTGYFIDVIAAQLIFNYTATYTVNSGDDLKLYYGSRAAGNAATASIETTGFLDATADSIIRISGMPDNSDPPVTNLAVVIQNTSGIAFGGGNAANDVKVVVHYRRVTTGL